MTTSVIVIDCNRVAVHCYPQAAAELRPEMSMLEYGEWVRRWQGNNWTVAGEVASGLQMLAGDMWDRHQARERRKRDGCCGAHMDEHGGCWETGVPCPTWEKVQDLLFQLGVIKHGDAS